MKKWLNGEYVEMTEEEILELTEIPSEEDNAEDTNAAIEGQYVAPETIAADDESIDVTDEQAQEV